LSGDSRYVDAFETSFYNAYLGSLNTEQIIEHMIKENFPDCVAEPLPFDSYSPLTAGTRGNGVAGFRVMSDNHYYGCCACIGSAGIGLVPQIHILKSANGLVINLYINGTVSAFTPQNNNIVLQFATEYPKCGNIKIDVGIETSETFEICLRNPAWSKNTKAYVNGNNVDVCDGYIILNRLWKNGDIIELDLDMRTEAVYPIPYGDQVLMNKVIWGKNYLVPTYDEEDPIAHKHIALRRGPVMLAQENRLGYSVDDTIDVKVDVPLSDRKHITVTDYSSAGKLWNEESKMAVWMLTK
jgi:DUF1680 family protein